MTTGKEQTPSGTTPSPGTEQESPRGGAFVTHNGQQVDINTVRGRMDQDILRRLEAEGKASNGNQALFDEYLKAHEQKHSKPFTV